MVFWITGLSGSGKTTLATEVTRLLRERSPSVVQLDGDAFRSLLHSELGYSMEDRLVNARRIARMCKFLSDQGVDVVCGTVSLFKECHTWNRAEISRYVEVLVEASPETLRTRDHKGLVSGAMAGRVAEVVGIQQPYDLPPAPEVVLSNDGTFEALHAKARGLVEQYWRPRQ